MKKTKDKKIKTDKQIKGSWNPKDLTPQQTSNIGESKSFIWLLSHVKLY